MAAYDNKVFNGERMSQLLGKVKDEFTFKVAFGNCANSSGDTTLTMYVGSAANDTAFALNTGVVVVVNFASNVGASATLNINGTGAKAIKFLGAALPANTIKAGDTVLLRYDGTNYNLITYKWRAVKVNSEDAYGDDSNTTMQLSDSTSITADWVPGTGGGSIKFYSKYAQGYCTCGTAAGTAAKTASLSDYVLNDGTIVAVKFTNGITVANATLAINSTTAKPIYLDGAALGANVISANETVLLFYNGSQYEIIMTKPNIGSKQDKITWQDSSNTTVGDVGTAYIKEGDHITFGTPSNGVISISSDYPSAATTTTLGTVKLAEDINSTSSTAPVVIMKNGESAAAANNDKLYVKDAYKSGSTYYSGTVKLYDNVTGENTDGAVAQNAIKSKFTSVEGDIALKAPLASPTLTGTPAAPTAATGTNTTQIATTAFVQQEIGAAQTGAAMFQGTGSTTVGDTTIQPDNSTATGAKKFSTLTDYKKGWYWVVRDAGTYAGNSCEAGDFIFCVADKGSSYSESDFSVVQNNLDYITQAEVNTLWSDVFTPST